MTTPTRPPLDWTEDNHAYRDRAHYHAYKRASPDPSGREWNLAVFSMHSNEPGGVEEKLGDYVLTTLLDAREFAQGLADQRSWAW
ncbi:hypothetical protein [Mycolicibacterium rhodesiae]|uniref:hypothetical protein n=1 Tax=Mycolicibacterium rhodesiae TaxID=36814 RepID=UPI001055B62D|nr:hypothetical protein [Mycolicibacterium rhodesiae]MCV7342978.1 hypothetical protein [Mycolicibacterium rhodesiae]